MAVGGNWYGQLNVSSWTNVKAIAVGEYSTVGIKEDGTVVAVGENRFGQLNLQSWDNIKQPVCASSDATPPITTYAIGGTAGSNGWYVSDVSITMTATDSDSGVKEVHYSMNGGAEVVTAGSSASVSLTAEGSHPVSYYAIDNAGNTEAAHSVSVSIDKTPPAITITGIADGASYTLGAVPTPGYTVTDNLSGVVSQNATLVGGNANGVGVYTYIVTASDLAGNTASATASYSIVYNFSGFLTPVSLDRPFRQGSTIPVKFQLTDASGTYISTATATITVQLFSADQPAGDPIEVTSTSGADTGNTFRYDAADSQYIYNLSTDGLYEGTWQIRATLDDGTVKTAFVSLKVN